MRKKCLFVCLLAALSLVMWACGGSEVASIAAPGADPAIVPNDTPAPIGNDSSTISEGTYSGEVTTRYVYLIPGYLDTNNLDEPDILDFSTSFGPSGIPIAGELELAKGDVVQSHVASLRFVSAVRSITTADGTVTVVFGTVVGLAGEFGTEVLTGEQTNTYTKIDEDTIEYSYNVTVQNPTGELLISRQSEGTLRK